MLRYAITEGRLSASQEEEAAVARWGAVLAEGVDFLLVREKGLEAGALVRVCRGVQGLAGGARVLVSGRADVARAAGLAGVHLSAAAGELTVGQVRVVMPGAYVSVACHTVGEVERAYGEGADAVLFAPVFGKWVDGREVVRGVGLQALAEACRVGVGVFALGGVTAAHEAACVAAGAVGIAGIRTFFGDGMP